MILGQKESVPDQWNCKVLRRARLIGSQKGGFITNKFQYVAYACHVDCNVTGGHGFCYQKNKNPLLNEGGFQYQGAGSVTLNLHPALVRLWEGGAYFLPWGSGTA
jgi:hypothetical protein